MNLVTEALLGAGRTTPSKVAVTTGDGRQVTYDEIDRLSGQLAHVLTLGHGVSAGDRVAIQASTSPEILALNIACARVGAIYVPLNSAYTDREVRGLLDDATPTLVVREETIEHVTPRASLSRLIAEAAEQSADFVDAPCDAHTPAAMLFTSGTTGRPKGAVLTHGNLVSNCEMLREVWEFRPEDVVLHVLPLFHTHGLFVAAYCALSSGASLLMMEGFDADDACRRLAEATVFMGVPTHYVRLNGSANLSREATATIRLFLSGSAPMRRSTHEEFAARTGQAIVERYGMTETGMITSNPIDGTRRVGTVGTALPGVMVRLDDTPVGGIEVKGPNVFSHYWNRPELGETQFTGDGWFKTGDVGTLDDDGFLEIVGRAKDLIISGGFNVYPKEVELVLDSFAGVAESAVIGLADDDLGEKVVAVVVPAANVHLDPQALITFAGRELSRYKVPRRVEVVDELPRNAMGKVQKAQLRRQLGARGPETTPGD
ncbi:MAG TPA: AMP-binding protein [Acidimicrobiales bacterium]|nr:AMP-binding protein [Acidimicrobiales bacterium]